MASFFDKYLTPISVGFPPMEVLATAGFALSIVDEKKTVLAVRQILLKFCRHRIKPFAALMRRMSLASITRSLLLGDH